VQTQPTINLTFHGIGARARALADGEPDVWLGRERFLAMLDVVDGRDDVHITFDDGNASDVEQALPALRDRGLTGTFFLVAGRLGEPGFVDAAGVRALAEAGMRVGCHGMRHRPWRGLDAAALHEELIEARRTLEDVLGAPVTEAACPFGAYDRRVLRALRLGGYRRVYTSDGGAAGPQDWLQPRTTLRAGGTAEGLRELLAGATTLPGALVRGARLGIKRWR
jgi:peptidoglycan/xylan/chitin deacetylase (PgdA/CDA1 family)